MTYAPGRDDDHPEILSALLADHRAAETLLARFDGLAVDERGSYFTELVRTLVAHEVAEEEILYPALRGVATRSEEAIRARLAEQSEAVELLKAMEDMAPEGPEFAAAFGKLRPAVQDHAAQEEATVFPLLVEFEEVLDRATMGVRYEQAKAAAPTHPHPHVPQTPPGNLVLGPVAAVADRVRDAVH